MADNRTAIETATARLRAEALAAPIGTLLGSEEALQRRLAISRPTMRQAARILEREGLLKVRRGNAGGYFAARPDAGFIEATVASYLEALHARPDDLARVATALWVEAAAKAARTTGRELESLAKRFETEIRAVTAETSFSDVMVVEEQVRRAVFRLIDSPYVELIFNINANYARRGLVEPPAARDRTDDHARFVSAWRDAMLMQVAAISRGDVELATLAAQRCRTLIHQRVWADPLVV